jgi:leucyl/phenylalanyl-tRNA--protein transferase
MEDDFGFPPPEAARRDGLLAIGGDLSPARLLAAYRRGIFPWPDPSVEEPLWFSPDPRFVLRPGDLHVSRRLERTIRSGRFEVRFDTAFAEVIHACATTRRRRSWITPAMEEAYTAMHRLGHAHSAEAWREGKLRGGVYGISIGAAFFGESMFRRETDASKVAFVALVRRLAARGFRLVDCQQATKHVARFGARAIPRARFLEELREAVSLPSRW